MGKNELVPGRSRVGVAWDQMQADPYPAMLVDVDGRIELVVPFDERNEVQHRRYFGEDAHWGDDPEQSKYDYKLPSQFWFADAHGIVCLVDVRKRFIDPWFGGPTVFAECRLEVGYAVFTGTDDVNYAEVNGLLTAVEGMSRWYGTRVVSGPEFGPRSAGRDITIKIHAPSVAPVHRSLNLSLVADVNWGFPGEPGTTSIDEVGLVRTLVGRPRDWSTHLDMHLAMHELLEVSAWRPLAVQRVSAHHARDPIRVLSGDVVGDRWASVHTYRLPSAEATGRPEFLFNFEDLGAVGVRKWLTLRQRFRRGIGAMTFGIRHRGTSLDGLISDAGIGLEEIGHRIALERGDARRRAHHLHLRDIADEVKRLLPFDADEWATRSTNVYNDVKHADRPDADNASMRDSLRESRMVFRIWLARRLGVGEKTIRTHMRQLGG